MKSNPAPNNRRRPARPKLHRTIRWLIALRGSPEAIAGGVAIGVFVAFTPTIGFQMVIAAFLATLLRANRPVAIAMVWLTNPFTIPPIFISTYWVGTIFRSGPPVAEVYALLSDTMQVLSKQDYWALHNQFTTFLAIGWQTFIPLLIGGVLTGTILGSISYMATLGTIRRYRRLRGTRKRQRAQRHSTSARRTEPTSPGIGSDRSTT